MYVCMYACMHACMYVCMYMTFHSLAESRDHLLRLVGKTDKLAAIFVVFTL